MEHTTDTLDASTVDVRLANIETDVAYLVNVVKQLEELITAMQSNPMLGMMLGK